MTWLTEVSLAEKGRPPLRGTPAPSVPGGLELGDSLVSEDGPHMSLIHSGPVSVTGQTRERHPGAFEAGDGGPVPSAPGSGKARSRPCPSQNVAFPLRRGLCGCLVRALARLPGHSRSHQPSGLRWPQPCWRLTAAAREKHVRGPWRAPPARRAVGNSRPPF